jgi:hypothetical protein
MSVTVQGAQEVEKLKFWKLEKYITIHQVCMLATGVDPGQNLFGYESFESRSGYEPIKSALTIKLTNYYYDFVDQEMCKEFDLPFAKESGRGFDPIFCPENIKAPARNGGISNDISLYRIKQTAVKQWLQSEGVHSAYFENLPDIAPNSEGSPFNKLNSQHSTKLLNIMLKTIERYYGANFDLNDKDTYPKQEHIITWLRSEFSLSKRKAEAIEIIIAPRAGNLP